MVLPVPPPPSPVRALLTGGELRLLDEGGGLVRRVRTEARELRWSPDGSTLLLRDAKGRLFRFEVAGRGGPVRISEGVSTFGWTLENRMLVGLPGRGALLLEADGKGITTNLLRAESPAIAPDGTRIAYVVPGEGLWIVAIDGTGARKIAASKDAQAPSWSYDGRLIAWTDGDRLRLTRREGGEGRDLGPVDDRRAVWSPGSAELLARRGGEWRAWSAGTGTWSPLGVRSPEPPVWTGPGAGLAVEDERLLTVRAGETPKPVELGRTRVVAVAERPTTFRGETFADPFARAPKLRAGETAWQGRVQSYEPKTKRMEFAVSAELSTTGPALSFGRPETRSATVAGREAEKRLPPATDAELQLTLRAGKIVGIYAPPLLPPPAPPTVAPPVVPVTTAPVATTPVRTGPAFDPVTGRALRPLRAVEADGITREIVVVPLVFPMPGPRRFTDTFLDARGGGTRRHHGNDLMAPKMTPLLAVFDGVVAFGRNTSGNAGNSLTLTSDDGWTASYLHVNNDTPGTDDGLGSARYAFPADLRPGDRVRAGEVVAWCGDSGNAEDAGSHLHFELFDRDGRAILNPFASLEAARHLDAPVYVDPDPTLKAGRDETRWEGVVVGVQAEKRAITVELTGLAEPGKPIARNLAPRLVYLEIPSDLLLDERGREGRIPFDAVRSTRRLGGVGIVTGNKMRVRRATIEADLR